MNDFLWHLANVIDVVHTVVIFPGIIAAGVLPLFVQREWIKSLAAGFVFSVIAMQLACQDCPIVILSIWLRHFKEPSIYEQGGVSWTYVIMHFFLPGPILHWALSVVCAVVALYFFRAAWGAHPNQETHA